MGKEERREEDVKYFAYFCSCWQLLYLQELEKKDHKLKEKERRLQAMVLWNTFRETLSLSLSLSLSSFLSFSLRFIDCL